MNAAMPRKPVRKSIPKSGRTSVRKSAPTPARKSDGFAEFVLDQLAELRAVTCRAMFGGYGLYRKGTFFGIIHRSRLYFKTDERTRAAYIARGVKPFRPNSKQMLKSYYEVPVEILEDDDQLVAWALQASSQP
jgi:DNA transformation protein